jgi:hypothetical protein
MSAIPSSKGFLPTATLAFCLAVSAQAQTTQQDIYKCVDGEATSYQSMPCGRGQTAASVLTVTRTPVPPTQAVAAIPNLTPSVPVAQSRGKMWPPRRTLMLGMSDDEVLNLPGWGVPRKITRTKSPREYKEEWTYFTPTGEQKLYFVKQRWSMQWWILARRSSLRPSRSTAAPTQPPEAPDCRAARRAQDGRGFAPSRPFGA